jgi:oxygen-dependent protoporphyrinogen oxidase
MNRLNSPHSRIAIVGGGISGLAAAWELAQQAPQAQVVLFEAQTRLGGVIETREIAGHTVECGPDSMLRRMPDAIGLCQELGIDDQLIGTNPAAAGVYSVHRGRLVRVPDGLAALAPRSRWQMATTPLLSLRGKLRLLGETRVPRRDAAAGDESLADFACRRFGREVFERIVQPLAGGIFMGDPAKLSLPACFPQFAKLEADHGSLVRGASYEQQQRAAKDTNPSIFVTPQQGIGRLVAALRSALPHVQFCLGTQVESIAAVGPRQWRLSFASDHAPAAGPADTLFDAVVVATPARCAATLLATVDSQVGELLAGIRSSNCAIAIVAARDHQVPHPLDATGFVVPHVEGRLSAAGTFSSQKYLGRAPDGEVTFRIFMGGAQHPELVDAPDARLAEIACSELQTLVGLRGEPLWIHIQRWPQSMPQYELGHLQRVEQIDHHMRQFPTLKLAGNAYRGVGIPYCIRSGREAARCLLAPADNTPPA